jgi:hypothetical protein
MKLSIDLWGAKPFGMGLEVLNLRQEVNEANAAATTAGDTAAGYGTQAAQEGAILNPALARETQAEHAFDPTQLNEMLTAAGAGVGGAMGAAETGLKRQAVTTGNAAGQAKGLDELARERMKTGAGVSEGIASEDVLGAQKLRQEGLQGEQGLYGENVKGQLAAMGQESSDINAATQASQTGWLQQGEGIANTAANVAKAFQPGM